MPVTTEEKKGGKKKGQQPQTSGTTAPLPTSEGKAKDPAKEKELSEMAKAQNKAIEETRAKLKALQEQLKAAKDAEKALKDQEKALKDEEKNKGKKEREAKEAAIKAADEAVTQAQKDLEATEEWSFLVEAKKAREALGKLPKARKTREGGGTRGKRANGLTPNMVKVLECMADGEEKTASQIANATGILKGKRLPELVEAGFLSELLPEESIGRGKRFVITDAGRDALEKAKSEPEEAQATEPTEE